MRGAPRRRTRYAAAVAYWYFARYLPWYPRPGGRAATRVRAFLARRMLDSCGTGVNVERGAYFGSGRGVELGDRSAIGLDCLVIGPLRVGRDVMMGPRCTMLAGRHATARTDLPMADQGFLPDLPIVIEDDVWIGANAVVLAGVVIGTGSIVGAGSVVTRDVPPFSVVGGNPARVIRSRR